MTNKKTWLGILVLTLVFGMTFIGCDEDNGSIETNPNGTWVHATYNQLELHMNNGSFEYSTGTKGTYTTNGNKITMTTTYSIDFLPLGGGGSQLYTKDQLKDKYRELGSLSENLSAFIDYNYSPHAYTYTINGDTFTFTLNEVATMNYINDTFTIENGSVTNIYHKK
jgi:hypothetical protein